MIFHILATVVGIAFVAMLAFGGFESIQRDRRK